MELPDEPVLPASTEGADLSDRHDFARDGTTAADGAAAAHGGASALAGAPLAAGGAPRSARSKRARQSKPARWWELPLLVAVAVLVAVLVKSFLVQPFYIPSDSMEKTLHGCPGCAGDKILVNKVIFHFRDPAPGDIVVFHAPVGWEEPVVTPQTNAVTGPLRAFGQLIGVVPPDETDLVKRVIATGGQAVRCCDAAGHVQVSDSGVHGPWRSLNETYVFDDNSMKFGPVLVPKGRLWVLGDHRGDSADSRYHPQGCVSVSTCQPVTSTVPVSGVIGKAFVIAWPPKRWRTLGTPKTFDSAAGLGASAPPAGIAMIAVAPLLWRRRRSRRGRRWRE